MVLETGETMSYQHYFLQYTLLLKEMYTIAGQRSLHFILVLLGLIVWKFVIYMEPVYI